MASSPPMMHNTIPPPSNPKKRASMSSAASGAGGSVKRPRLSHPLRQTSFPANDAAAFYASVGPQSARSETGSIAASAFSNTSTTVKPRGRGRPRKNALPVNTDDGGNDGASSQGGGRGDGKSAASGHHGHRNAGAGGDNDDAGDEDEDDAADMARFSSTHHTESEKQLDAVETQRRDRLKDALNNDQMARLEKWRAVSFPKRTVQKLVNQIVSQSVTESPINAVRVYAKWFVAEIVERAREVQDEYARGFESGTRQAESKRRADKVAVLREQLRKEDEKKSPDGAGTPGATGTTTTTTTTTTPKMSEYDRRRLLAQIDRAQKDADEYIPNPHRGGLTPDHLREALRRYKSDGEGGGVGFEGLSHPLLGIHGSKIWAQGDGNTAKRLFR